MLEEIKDILKVRRKVRKEKWIFQKIDEIL